jgi:hypothetical protein
MPTLQDRKTPIPFLQKKEAEKETWVIFGAGASIVSMRLIAS